MVNDKCLTVSPLFKRTKKKHEKYSQIKGATQGYSYLWIVSTLINRKSITLILVETLEINKRCYYGRGSVG
jgi:hypothetical protein